MKYHLACWCAGTTVYALFPVWVQSQVLYDPSAGTLPNAQGWSYLSLPVAAQLEFTDGSTQLNTQSLAQILAGFSRVAPVPLDRAAGFTLHFNLEILAEDHGTRVDRAGLSVTVLAADRKGIELGFWADRIWAQSDAPMFTHAEEALWNSVADFTEFALTVQGDTYSLSANEAPLLTGPVRDYTPFVGSLDPYETPNFLFFGDNTTSARASIALRQIALTPLSPTLSAQMSGSELTLSWPVSTSPWELQATGALDADAVWKSVNQPVIEIDSRYQISVPVSEAQQYFRLSF